MIYEIRRLGPYGHRKEMLILLYIISMVKRVKRL